MGFFDDTASTPGLTFAEEKPPAKVAGILVPNEDGKAYTESQQTHIDTGEPLTYDDGAPRMQAVLYLQTELRDWAFTTDKFKEKAAADAEMVDVGVRKLYVRGATMTKGFKTALKGLKAKAPVAGMAMELTLVRRKPNTDRPGKENIFEVELSAPNATSLAVVQAYLAAQGSEFMGDDGSGDADSSTDDDAPPF